MSSNANGRALEYCLCNMILTNVANTRIDSTNSTVQDQIRDQVHFNALPKRQQSYYQNQCLKYIEQYLLGVICHFAPPIVVRRLNDNDAKSGDVADIKIISALNEEYGISLKHNHEAVKHQRPGALIKQLGILPIEKEIYRRYKEGIERIEYNFYQQVKALGVEQKLFKLVKAKNPQIILNLYHDICTHVANTINQYGQNPDIAEWFFESLVGAFNFDKVIVTEQYVKVMKFNNIALPSQMSATVRGSSYVDLVFNNGFEFAMRLHTASSKFSYGNAVSLKFDTQLTSDAGLPVVVL